MASNDVAVDSNGDKVGNSHCNEGQRPLRLLAMAYVTAGNGICNGRQWQAKAAPGIATVTAGDNSYNSGQRRAKAATKMGGGCFLDSR